MERLLNDPKILDEHVRATAGVNALEGVGMIEAPRGVLIHHYKVNPEGASFNISSISLVKPSRRNA